MSLLINELTFKHIVKSGSSDGNSFRVRDHTRVCSCDITISPFRISFTIATLHHFTVPVITSNLGSNVAVVLSGSLVWWDSLRDFVERFNSL